MVDRLKKIGFIRGNNVMGVQISFHSSHVYIINIVIVKKHRNKISVVKQLVDINSIEEIKSHLWKNAPVVLCIDGKSLIHKHITEDVGKNPLDLVLPNAKRDEFYVQVANSANGAFISVIRKEIVNNLVENFATIGVIPTSIFLGPFILSSTNFVFTNDLKFNTEFWEIHGNVEFVNYTTAVSKYDEFENVGGERIKGSLLPAYGLSVSYLIGLDVEEIEASTFLNEQFIYKRAVWLLGWSMLAFVFVILLVNFLFFSSYNDKYLRTSNLLQQQQSLLNRNEILKEEYAKKRKFVDRSGLLQTSKFSFYFDRIASLLPDSIQLSYLALAPADERIRNGRPIIYQENIIVIAGKSKDSKSFDIWKERMKREKWLNDIFIVSFGQEEPRKPIHFELQIEIKK